VSCVLGITGGIGSGKSTFVKELLKYYSARFFDSDRVARELFELDSPIQVKLYTAFPEAVLDGKIDRNRLRALVFSDKERRKHLESIIHPEIRNRWVKQVDQARGERTRLVVDIPLLFETGAEEYFDAIVVVACTKPTQIQRLKQNRNMDEHMAKAIIASQEELSKKYAPADHLVWNESSQVHLNAQARFCGGSLMQRYG
jgi:dephospho-CoA kinase